jgi:glycosyltransferase involved in cell wall biosynthesis
VLTDPELSARLGAAGRRRFVERFTPERMVQGHIELYDQLLARRRDLLSRRRPGRERLRRPR